MGNLNWLKCGNDGHWCSLEQLDLTTVNENGVYIIWYAGNPGRVVRIGQGDISARLSEHRNNAVILAYNKYGKLNVTWATVPSHQMDGVEKYLADTLNPLVGDAFPKASPIVVNSPFAA